MADWHALSPTDKATWNDIAKQHHLSGINYFIRLMWPPFIPSPHLHVLTLQDALDAYDGTTDTWTQSGPDCLNNGGTPELAIRAIPTPRRFAFVNFLLPQISPPPTILEANLDLTCTAYAKTGTGSLTLNARPIVRLWGEGTGTGGPPGIGDLDAYHAQHPTVLWTAMGADNVPEDTLPTEDTCDCPTLDQVATLSLLESIAAHYADTRPYRGHRLHLSLSGFILGGSISVASRSNANTFKRPILHIYYQHSHP